MGSGQKEMLYSLQIGRALAALMVVLCHAVVAARQLSPELPDIVFDLFDVFDLGVDYFFVLSGFIIAHTTWDRPADSAHARHYARSRALRIYIPYIPVALGLIAINTLFPALDNTPYSLFGSLTLLPSNEIPVISVAWSLQHEIIFYLLFGICFFVLKDRKLIYLWAIPIFILPFLIAPRWTAVIAAFCNLEFLFGIAACAIYHAGHLKRPIALVTFGIALVLIGGACIHEGGLAYYFRVIAGLGFAAILLGLVYLEERIDFSRFRTLVFLGAASYSIYLVHLPFMFASLRIMPTMPHWAMSFAVFITIGVAAGLAYYFIVEKPLMRLARKRIPT
jgi:exopolysaccharide production protein ExoZ